MDSAKLFIDTDNEITFILEKILASRSEKICLVVPDRASLFNSISGLKLIQRVINKSNKLLILVTLDSSGIEQAKKIGMVAVTRVGEVNDDLWEQSQRQKFEAQKKYTNRVYYVPEKVDADVRNSEEEVGKNKINDAIKESGIKNETISLDSPEMIKSLVEAPVIQTEPEVKDIPEVRISLNESDIAAARKDQEIEVKSESTQDFASISGDSLSFLKSESEVKHERSTSEKIELTEMKSDFADVVEAEPVSSKDLDVEGSALHQRSRSNNLSKPLSFNFGESQDKSEKKKLSKIEFVRGDIKNLHADDKGGIAIGSVVVIDKIREYIKSFDVKTYLVKFKGLLNINLLKLTELFYNLKSGIKNKTDSRGEVRRRDKYGLRDIQMNGRDYTPRQKSNYQGSKSAFLFQEDFQNSRKIRSGEIKQSEDSSLSLVEKLKLMLNVKQRSFWFYALVFFVLPILIIALIAWSIFNNTSTVSYTVVLSSYYKPVSTSKTIQAGYENPNFKLTKLEDTVSLTSFASTTGEKTLGSKSTGTVTIFNLTSEIKVIPKGTKITCVSNTCSSLTFTTLEAINIGPLDNAKNIKIEANDIGLNYNLASSIKFKVANYITDDVFASNTLPFSGGTAKQVVKVVTEKDISDLEAKTLNDLKTTGYNKFIANSSYKDKYTFQESLVVVEKVSSEVDEVGKETDTLNLTLTAKASVDAFEKSQLEPVYQEMRSSLAPEGYYLDDRSYSKSTPAFQFNGGDVSVGLKVSGIARISVDEKTLKEKLKGKHINDAKNVLDEIPNVTSYRATYLPSIMPEFLKFVPLDPNRIEIRHVFLDPVSS